MGQTNSQPSVWCSKYYHFSWFLVKFFAKIRSIYFSIFLKNTKIKTKSFEGQMSIKVLKKLILGTSNSWSTICLSHRPSDPAYFIVNWRNFNGSLHYFVYELINSNWNEMLFNDSQSSGTVLDNTLFIQNRDELLSVKSSGAIRFISNLPYTLAHSCMLALNETALGLFGGVNSEGTKNSMLIYNLSKICILVTL